MMRQVLISFLAMIIVPTGAIAQIFITEVADPNDNDIARYIELFNAGESDVDLSTGDGYLLRRYTNGGSTFTESTIDNLTGVIPANGTYVIAVNPTAFQTAFGVVADQDGATGGSSDSNGDDNIELLDPSGTVIDVYGVPGTDGSGTCHEFEDGRAERKATVTTGSATWDSDEWNVQADNEVTGCVTNDPVDVADGVFDPGEWIGAEPDVIKDEPTNQPSGFTVSSEEFDIADLSWTDAVEGTQAPDGYLILVSTSSISDPTDGTDPALDSDLSDGSGVFKVSFVGADNLKISGLDENTTYNFAIYSYTNTGSDIDFNVTSAPSSSATTNSKIFAEDFEGFTDGQLINSNGFTSVDLGGPNNWVINNFGSNFAEMSEFFDSSSDYTHEDWFLLPPINLNSFDDAVLSFTSAVRFKDGDALSLQISTDYHTVSDFSDATWTDITSSVTLASDDNFTSSGLYDLSTSYDNQIVTLAFYYKPDATNPDDGQWRIDNIRVSGTASTTEVTALGSATASTDLTLASSVTTSGNVVMNDLTIGSAVRFTIADGDVVTIYGDIENLGGTLEIASGGSLIVFGNNTLGDVITSRTAPSAASTGDYSFAGTVVEQSASIIGAALGSFVYKYDETETYGSARWVDATFDQLVPGVGYTSVADEIDLIGTPIADMVEVSGLTWTDGAPSDDNEGWHLVSNPYTAAIDADAFLNDNTNLAGSIYLWDDGGNSINGTGSNADYLVYNSMGTSGGNGASFSGNIASGQGFFVKLNAIADDGSSLFFKPGYRVTTSSSNGAFIRTKSSIQRFKIMASSEGVTSETLIGYHENATEDVDRLFDAYKLKNERHINIASKIGESSFAIQGLPEISSIPVDLEVEVMEDAMVVFSIGMAENIEGYDIILFDSKLNEYHNLSSSDKAVKVSTGDKDRFAIILRESRITDLQNQSSLQIVALENECRIYGVNNIRKLTVTTISGEMVGEITHPQHNGNYYLMDSNHFETGLYIISVMADEGIFTQKILID